MSWGERSCRWAWRNDKPCKPEFMTCNTRCSDYYERGRVAYEAYCKKTDNKSLATGHDLPTWDKLPRAIKEAWDCAELACTAASAKR